ncbi:hypothetical protein [Xenorhabdus miraniensis]|uniref:O-antigen polymerase n=1 Tax=Xenorhabdus miraniensis TaxID=351674 RepID=A0A2D0JLU0_9GAMM|nr:hypothetical protein [Xenorhabdus miraniensis]PHM47216.1 hypothetical protein Xmir_03429 [Xenorhabdus miraniensis]
MQITKQNILFGYLWLLGSNLYFTQITQFSPIYIIAFILSLTIILYSMVNKKLTANEHSFYFLLATILSLLLFLNSPFNMVLNIIISLLSPIITSHFLNHKKASQRVILIIFITLAFIFIFDGIWRINNPNLENKEVLENLDLGYMIYKTNSLMYRDSNFLGIQIIAILSSFLFIFKDGRINKFTFYIIISLFLLSIALTFSRASLISAIICIYFFIYRNKGFILFILTPIIIIFTIPFFINEFNTDLSFNSKFYIINAAVNNIENSSLLNIFFGYGLGNSINIIGIGAHNLLLTILLEMGLTFFILFIIYLIYLIKVFKIHFLYLVFPFMISSFSLSGTSLPYFFSYITLCLLIHNNKVSIN